MATSYRLVCTGCGKEAGYSSFRCSYCASILEVKFDYDTLVLPKDFKKSASEHYKYLPFFPIERFRIRSREGGTPITMQKALGKNIMFKLETENPTHSFKDRGSVVEVNRAIELKAGAVCCASTGNMGISVAHYARIAGIKCTIFLSHDANADKVAKIKRNGARIIKVKGDFNKALGSAEAFARKTGAFVCGDYHYRKEGQKSVIFELIEQLHYNVPDFIFVPVGNATLLSAMYKGLMEFRRFSLIGRFPRLVAVQSERCDPLVRAYNSGTKVKYAKPRTIADAIAVGFPTFGFEGIRALRSTKGIGLSVTEQEIKNAVTELDSLGIKAESGGAAGFAGFRKAYGDKKSLFQNKKIVVLVTGNNESIAKISL
jgi:threonine synthase